MAIEPLGTVMSYQAQTTNVTKTAENTDVAAETMQTNNVDMTTATVEATSASQNQEGQDNRKGASNEQAKQAASQYTKLTSNTKAVFGVHEATNRITIKSVDKDTDKVIKEFPAEKTLDMIARVWEMAGIMVDEKR